MTRGMLAVVVSLAVPAALVGCGGAKRSSAVTPAVPGVTIDTTAERLVDGL